MKRIINKCPCSLEAWVGADEPVFSEQNLYFSRKVEVKEYLYKVSIRRNAPFTL